MSVDNKRTITETELKQIIQEELEAVLTEGPFSGIDRLRSRFAGAKAGVGAAAKKAVGRAKLAGQGIAAAATGDVDRLAQVGKEFAATKALDPKFERRLGQAGKRLDIAISRIRNEFNDVAGDLEKLGFGEDSLKGLNDVGNTIAALAKEELTKMGNEVARSQASADKQPQEDPRPASGEPAWAQ
jgi:hypothetical protein